MREVWAITSDQHCGSTLGLCPPGGIPLDDGGHYRPSNAQVRLWESWIDFWGSVRAKLRRGDRLLLALNGDLVDGDHHQTAQIVSKNLAATQHAIAMATLAPALELQPKAVFVIRGTEAHVGRSAAAEEAIGRELEAVRNPETGAASWWHLQARSQGALLDLAHHGSVGRLPHTRTNPLGTLAMRILNAAAKADGEIPDLAVRSHLHQWADTGDNYRVRVLQLAGWQLSTAYVHRVAAGSLPEIGGAIVVAESGHLEIEKVKYHWRRQEPWTWTAKLR